MRNAPSASHRRQPLLWPAAALAEAVVAPVDSANASQVPDSWIKAKAHQGALAYQPTSVSELTTLYAIISANLEKVYQDLLAQVPAYQQTDEATLARIRQTALAMQGLQNGLITNPALLQGAVGGYSFGPYMGVGGVAAAPQAPVADDDDDYEDDDDGDGGAGVGGNDEAMKNMTKKNAELAAEKDGLLNNLEDTREALKKEVTKNRELEMRVRQLEQQLARGGSESNSKSKSASMSVSMSASTEASASASASQSVSSSANV